MEYYYHLSPEFDVFRIPEGVFLVSAQKKLLILSKVSSEVLTAIVSDGPSATESLVKAIGQPEMLGPALQELQSAGVIIRVPGRSKSLSGIESHWVRLGVSAATIAELLSKSAIRIVCESASLNDALRTALARWEVRIVDRPERSSMDLYVARSRLDPAIESFGKQMLDSERPWLPVILEFDSASVGPLIRKRGRPCWSCVRYRIARNEEVRAYLQRFGTLMHQNEFVPHPAAEFVAAQVAELVVTDFSSGAIDHLRYQELGRESWSRHDTARREACPTCGDLQDRSPLRRFRPPVLSDEIGEVWTSGGLRSIRPAETIERMRSHISPITGIVSRISPLTSDRSMFVTVAKHGSDPFPPTLDHLTASISQKSSGKGSTIEQATASAIGEAVERYSAAFQGNEIRHSQAYEEFEPGAAIAPNDEMLFSARQFASRTDQQRAMQAWVPELFDTALPIEWTPAWSLRDGVVRYVPVGLAYFFYRGPGDRMVAPTSNGIAAGNTLSEAVLQGLLELVERDAMSLWWFNKLGRATTNLANVQTDGEGQATIDELVSLLGRLGMTGLLVELTSDLGLPVFGCLAMRQDSNALVAHGFGCHACSATALLRAATELRQGLLRAEAGTPRAAVMPSFISASADSGTALEVPRASAIVSLSDCVERLTRRGLDVLMIDLSRPDIPMRVARMVVPGLRHHWPRLGPGRLYDVPLSMGWLREPRSELELNSEWLD